MKVAIVGAGNGGLTACADLKERGFEVSLFESDKFCKDLDFIKKEGGLYLCEGEIGSSEGEKGKFIEIDLISDDINEVIKGAEVVMVVAPGVAIEYFARILAPVVNEDQIILINCAACMAPVRFINEAKEMGINKRFKIAETNTLTYGTRAIVESAKIELYLRAKKVYLAAYPSSDNEEVFEVCKKLYDCFVLAKNILQVNLENGNPEVHPGPCLLNAGRIDFSGGEFWLYREGITEHTINVLEAVEKERITLGRALGFEVEGALEARQNRGYFSQDEKTLQEHFNTSEVFTQIKGPTSVTSRYFTEDISTGLVFWSDLGKVLGIPTPNIDAIIVLASSLLKTDFYAEGLTLDKLGLDKANLDKVM